MTQVARCCLCDKRIRIPDVDSNTWVRCPHCREEYQLSRIANDLPPRLEVLENRPLVIDSAASGSPNEMPTDFSGVQDPLSDGESDMAFIPALMAIDPVTPLTEQVDVTPSVPSPQTLHANRVKKSGSSGLWSAAKIALGGLAGLLVGQAILWWLPAPYQSDPFDLAAKVPASIEFVLPPSLQRNSVPETISVEPKSDVPETAVVSIDSVVEPAMPADASNDRHGNVGGQAVPPTDLNISLQTAIAEDTALEGQTRDVESWYGGLRQLALCVTNIDDINSVNIEVIEDLTRFLLRVSEDPRRFSAIAENAISQLETDPLRDQQGIVLAGSVSEIRPAGELFRTTVRIRMGESGQSVDVISRSDPREKNAYSENDMVLVLGVVITDPVELAGYKGANQAVVFGGFPVKCDQVVRPGRPGILPPG